MLGWDPLYTYARTHANQHHPAGTDKMAVPLTKCHDKMAVGAPPCVKFTQEPKIENFAFLLCVLIVHYGRSGFLTPQF